MKRTTVGARFRRTLLLAIASAACILGLMMSSQQAEHGLQSMHPERFPTQSSDGIDLTSGSGLPKSERRL